MPEAFKEGWLKPPLLLNNPKLHRPPERQVRALFPRSFTFLLLMVSSFLILTGEKSSISIASATNPLATVGMPFTGKWAYNVNVDPPYTDLNSSHPSVHAKYYGDWATDVYAADGTAVKLKVSSSDGPLSFYWIARPNGTCGQRTVIGVKVNGIDVGSIYYEHLNGAVTSGNITNGMTVGYVHDWQGCNPGPHVHIELRNTSNYSCYTDNGKPGVTLSAGDSIGLLGSSNTAARQACADSLSMPPGPPPAVPGPGLHSFIASATNLDGTIELFGIGLNSDVEFRRQTTPNTDSWGGWQVLQGGNARSITATHMADGRIVVFFISSSDSHPRYYMQTAPNVDNWTPMAVFPGGLKVISSAINADGTIELFAVGLAGELYADRELAPNADSWGGWYQLQGGTGATVTASRMSDGRLLAMFSTSDDGSLHYYLQGSPSVDNWGPMAVFTGGLSAVTSAVNLDGTIELFGIGLNTSNYTVYGMRQSAPSSGAWNGWYPIQGGNAMSITAAPNKDGRLTVFFIVDDGTIHYYTQGAPNVDNWTAMQVMSGQLHP